MIKYTRQYTYEKLKVTFLEIIELLFSSRIRIKFIWKNKNNNYLIMVMSSYPVL